MRGRRRVEHAVDEEHCFSRARVGVVVGLASTASRARARAGSERGARSLCSEAVLCGDAAFSQGLRCAKLCRTSDEPCTLAGLSASTSSCSLGAGGQSGGQRMLTTASASAKSAARTSSPCVSRQASTCQSVVRLLSTTDVLPSVSLPHSNSLMPNSTPVPPDRKGRMTAHSRRGNDQQSRYLFLPVACAMGDH